MANMNFDFNKIQRSFFKTTLKDGRELVVKMPMKKHLKKLRQHRKWIWKKCR